MNDVWQDSADKSQGIVKAKGTPTSSDDSQLSRRDIFPIFCRLIGRKLAEGGVLIDEFVNAKVAHETNSAIKTIEEAAEAASRREKNNAKTKMIQQQTAGAFIENLDKTKDLPLDLQELAMSKLLESDPALLEQWEKIRQTKERLEVVYQSRIETDPPVLEQLSASGESLHSSPPSEASRDEGEEGHSPKEAAGYLPKQDGGKIILISGEKLIVKIENETTGKSDIAGGGD